MIGCSVFEENNNFVCEREREHEMKKERFRYVDVQVAFMEMWAEVFLFIFVHLSAYKRRSSDIFIYQCIT